MAVITVPASGLQVSSVTLDDTLQAGSDVDPNGVTFYEVDGSSALRSLFIGSSIEVVIGFLSSGTLTGAGAITGASDPAAGTLPAISNYGTLDINGAIDVALTNYGRLAVAAGERLDVEGDLFGLSASTVSVASGGELDVNSLNTALVSALDMQGTLKITAPNTSLSGATSLAGAVIVQGDAPTGFGSGTPAARNSGNANGTYVAMLDTRQATLSAPVGSLTLGPDAAIQFGTGAYAVKRLSITGATTGLAATDGVSIGGTLTITGDGSGTPNQVAVSRAEFSGAGTVAFAVAATDGSASLQQLVTVDAGTTLRNDGSMVIGGQGAGATTIGATSAAPGSILVNGASGRLTIGGGASLSVAAVQNAGAITVAGTATVLQPLVNAGTIDITSGTLALEANAQGAGTITVESGAVLSIDAPSQGAVALRGGGMLRLSQPATFAGAVQAPAIGAAIDLVGVNATAATVSNGSIVVTTATGTINLAETGLINGATLAFGADGAGGSLISVPSAAVPHPVVYRFFDDVHGTHFFTSSLTETQSLQSTRPDLVYEGVGLTATDPAIDSAAAPVFRFFDTKFGTHFYTSSTTERDSVIATRADLTFEGVGFYEHTTAQQGDVPVYRFFDKNFGTHFYTASASEQASIVATRPDLASEGIGFYAPSS